MKYLKKYENTGFDVQFAIFKIGDNFDFNVEIKKEEEEWPGEGQAQRDSASSVVIRKMINWFKENHKEISVVDENSLKDALKKHYKI